MVRRTLNILNRLRRGGFRRQQTTRSCQLIKQRFQQRNNMALLTKHHCLQASYQCTRNERDFVEHEVYSHAKCSLCYYELVVIFPLFHFPPSPIHRKQLLSMQTPCKNHTKQSDTTQFAAPKIKQWMVSLSATPRSNDAFSRVSSYERDATWRVKMNATKESKRKRVMYNRSK
jgi:hypothetical protein